MTEDRLRSVPSVILLRLGPRLAAGIPHRLRRQSADGGDRHRTLHAVAVTGRTWPCVSRVAHTFSHMLAVDIWGKQVRRERDRQRERDVRERANGPDWNVVDEGWGRKAVDFVTLSEPANCREYSPCITCSGSTTATGCSTWPAEPGWPSGSRPCAVLSARASVLRRAGRRGVAGYLGRKPEPNTNHS
jgi:hypothetical protein